MYGPKYWISKYESERLYYVLLLLISSTRTGELPVWTGELPVWTGELAVGTDELPEPAAPSL